MIEFCVLVCGGRNYNNKDKVYETLNELKRIHDNISQVMITKPTFKIIQGGAKGADYLAHIWAKENKIQQEQYDADWKLYGKRAGPIRNELMITLGNPNLVVAFTGGEGTKNMISLANKYNIPVEMIND